MVFSWHCSRDPCHVLEKLKINCSCTWYIWFSHFDDTQQMPLNKCYISARSVLFQGLGKVCVNPLLIAIKWMKVNLLLSFKPDNHSFILSFSLWIVDTQTLCKTGCENTAKIQTFTKSMYDKVTYMNAWWSWLLWFLHQIYRYSNIYMNCEQLSARSPLFVFREGARLPFNHFKVFMYKIQGNEGWTVSPRNIWMVNVVIHSQKKEDGQLPDVTMTKQQLNA